MSLFISVPAETLDWPAGTFSFPKPSTGCPPGFDEGCVFQNNANNSPNNQNDYPPNIDQLLDGFFGVDLQLCYCTEQQAFSTVPFWPEGQYCLAKKGPCPVGFGEGSIFWDDNNIITNQNNVSGVIPDGTYDTNTEIQYCCRADGDVDRAIPLPTTHDFVLYRSPGVECQDVQGMTDSRFSIRTDDDNFLNQDVCRGMHPSVDDCGPNIRTGNQRNIRVRFCHYTKSE